MAYSDASLLHVGNAPPLSSGPWAAFLGKGGHLRSETQPGSEPGHQSLKVGLYWKPGQSLRYYINDAMVAEIQDEAATKLSGSYAEGGVRVPVEPMYLVVAATATALEQLPEMTRVGVDFIRLYQHPTHVSTTCDTPSHPTSAYIGCHPEEFLLPGEPKKLAGSCS